MSEEKHMPGWQKIMWAILSVLALIVVVIRLSESKTGGYEYKCKDKDKAVLAWRESCNSSNLLAWAPFRPAEIYKQWCRCVEEKFDAQRLAGENCKVSSATVEGVYNLEEVKAACGTPAEPR